MSVRMPRICLLGAVIVAMLGGGAARAAGADTNIVVVADAEQDETENARVRASVYEHGRKRGLEPDTKADVTGKATESGALEAGVVSSEPERLEKLRAALGARALVRIVRTSAGVRVLLVTSSGVTSRDVASADAAAGAARELLDALGGPKPAAPAPKQPAGEPMQVGVLTGAEPAGRAAPDIAGSGSAWQERGGPRFSYGVQAALVGLYVPRAGFADTNPVTSQLEVSRADTFGVGAGLGVQLSMMMLPLPEPADGSTSFAAFRVGVGATLAGLYVRPPKGFDYRLENNQVTSRDTAYANKAYVYGVFPLQLGVHFAFGEHRTATLWRGLAFGLAYSPAVIASLEVGKNQDEIQGDFNYGGFELSLDIIKLDTTAQANSQLRLAVLVLPRVSDDLYWMTTASIGAVWY